MSARAKRIQPKLPTGVPAFITKQEICMHLGLVRTDTLDQWVRQGEFPPPHSRPAIRHPVWRRDQWQEYVETGYWPKDAWPRRDV